MQCSVLFSLANIIPLVTFSSFTFRNLSVREQMGCCASKDTSERGQRRRSLVKPHSLPPSRKAHLRKPQAALPPPPEEEEMPRPKRNSAEIRGAGDTLKLRLEDEVPETKILFSKLEEAVETISEYCEMYTAARGSLPIETTNLGYITDNNEVTSADPWEGKHPLPGEERLPRSHSHSPLRRPQVARPEFRGERRREFSGELWARQRNVGPAGGGSGGASQRSSRSQAPVVRRVGRGNKPDGTVRRPPVEAEISGRWPWELAGGVEDVSGEGREEVAEEEPEVFTTVSQQGNEPFMDDPRVSLECFIFL